MGQQVLFLEMEDVKGIFWGVLGVWFLLGGCIDIAWRLGDVERGYWRFVTDVSLGERALLRWPGLKEWKRFALTRSISA